MVDKCGHLTTIAGMCADCEKMIWVNESITCDKCRHYRPDSTSLFGDVGICRKKLMSVTATMKVFYKVDEGSCLEPISN